MIITAGKYKGRKIAAPDESITRPTLSKVRMGVFNTLYSLLEDFSDKTFLDVFGGSGIMGLEAVSRGFKAVKVCEINKKSATIIKKNYEQLKIKQDLFIGNSLVYLKKYSSNFDVIYVDPPYKSGIYEEVLSLINSGLIVLEHSDKIDISGFELLKQKNYGGKLVTFLKKETS